MGNDPISNIDPTGLAKIEVGGSLNLVVKFGLRFSMAVSFDTKNYEIGGSLTGGPALGLDVGVGVDASISPSGDKPAVSDVNSSTAVTVQGNIGPVSASKELASYRDGEFTMEGDPKVGVSGGPTIEPQLKVGASVGLDVTIYGTSDVVARAADSLGDAVNSIPRRMDEYIQSHNPPFPCAQHGCQ